jgi:hypothetical protein
MTKAILNKKASKLLEGYSQAKGLTPSQAVIHFVEYAEPDDGEIALDRLLARPLSKMSDKAIHKLAVSGVKRQRSS